MKKYVAKCLLNVFLTEDEVLMCYKDSDQNISARSLTLLTFALVWALCGQPQPKHESEMSLSPLNVLTCCAGSILHDGGRLQ